MEFERDYTTSHALKNSLWRRLWTYRKTDNTLNESLHLMSVKYSVEPDSCWWRRNCSSNQILPTGFSENHGDIRINLLEHEGKQVPNFRRNILTIFSGWVIKGSRRFLRIIRIQWPNCTAPYSRKIVTPKFYIVST
jgi:hypothetical protein